MRIFSKFVATASWLAAILTGLVTVFWVMIVADGNDCWAAFAFTMMAISFGGGILVLGVAPSIALYLRKKQREDLLSLLLSGCSLVTVLIEAGSLFIIPQRGE